jgi:DNA-binding CsgD family transcriptional regulator
VTLWQDHSYCALILGDIDLAKSCTERALLICRQHRFVWFIPFLCLEYANILTLLSQPSSAYGYLLEALSCDARAPILERALAETGIPLALQMKDEAMLAKCGSPAVVTRVFQSGEPENISSVAAAFAKLYRAQGEGKEAQALLHRALEAVRPAAYGWDLPLEVARQGAAVDIPRARILLEARTTLPCSAVVRACLSLFDAHVAQREGAFSIAYTYAKAARDQFEVLNWRAYADEARSLLPYVQDTPHPSRTHVLPFTGMQAVLTKREQQVAVFVLQGLTNRAIATELSISRHTVDSHVASIMSRLGIRSRYQLATAYSKVRDR